ncbi:response regulator [Natronococcus sp. A-GB1]|uniref:Response regulator receiver protein n=1 Tax=Natronococcus amylolyticus DSM 10524 TaxID=1227497 RepID=L9XEX9_9EURY|nr:MULTISPECIES: response regulator [Natronococcus]ELY60280.1 response regulator receiver protein [Natronococcus amylolyticus DSM 10524]MDG5759252.1 response regulator [Natronococcus sp. A-GB1]
MTDSEASKRVPPSEPSSEDAEILLVEDNPGDVRLLQEALAVTAIPHQLHVVTNGDEAVEFVYQRGEYADAPQPDLILLDLNLPHTDGHEVLTEVKSDPEHSRIPIIVLSSSNDDDDIQRAYAAGANAYLTKPVDPDELVERVELIQTFWFSLAQLPD